MITHHPRLKPPREFSELYDEDFISLRDVAAAGAADADGRTVTEMRVSTKNLHN